MLLAVRPDPKLAWWLSRASGIVAVALVMGSLGSGMALAGKLTRKVPPPAWNLDLHRQLGALAAMFAVVHVGGLVADNYTHFGPSDVLIPFASAWKPEPVAWGIVAAYLLVTIECTSLLKKHLPLKVWRWVHGASYAMYPAAILHSYRAGTDMHNLPLLGAILVVAIAILIVGVLRVALPAARNTIRSTGGAARSRIPPDLTTSKRR